MQNQNITMESFQYLLKEKLEEHLGSKCHVAPQKVTKNNGICLQGLRISHDSSNISPTIYINHFYEKYQDDKISLEESVSGILTIYHHHKVNHYIDMDTFMSFEKAKQRICYKLINTEANRELLEEVPHKDYFDLSIVYIFEVNTEPMENACILIRNDHLANWNITEEELHQVASENTPRLHPYHIESLQKVMQEICMEQLEHLADDEYQDLNEEERDMMERIENMHDDCGMYVLSNKNRMFGAACMLYLDILKDFAAATGKNLMILPSSVHEVLILPVADTSDAEHFKECVMDVNRTQLEEEDILSDSVYYFDKEYDELTKIL